MPRPRRWTKTSIAEAMRRWRAATGHWPAAVDWTPSEARKRGRSEAVAEWQSGGYPHASAVRNVYGSWGAALAAVTKHPRGLPYTHRQRRVKQWTREQIVAAVQRWADQNGRPPSYQDWNPSMARRRGRPDVAEAFYAGDWPDSSVAARHLGGWNEVLRAAGFAERGPAWQIEE